MHMVCALSSIAVSTQLAHSKQLEGAGGVEEEKQRQRKAAISQERLEREKRDKQERLHAWKVIHLLILVCTVHVCVYVLYLVQNWQLLLM